jgi:hypothetical protein
MKNLIIEFTNEVPPQPDTTYTVLVRPAPGKHYFIIAEYMEGRWYDLERYRWLDNVIAWGRHPYPEALEDWLRVNGVQ